MAVLDLIGISLVPTIGLCTFDEVISSGRQAYSMNILDHQVEKHALVLL